MAKAPDAFRTISEVAEALDTPAHVLRFWESKFTQVKPVKRAGGRRYYRREDIALLGGIKKLLHEDGMTIKAVQQMLRSDGVKPVAALYHDVNDTDIIEATRETDATAESNVVPLTPAPAVPDRDAEKAAPEPADDNFDEAIAELISEKTDDGADVEPAQGDKAPVQVASEDPAEPALPGFITEDQFHAPASDNEAETAEHDVDEVAIAEEATAPDATDADETSVEEPDNAPLGTDIPPDPTLGDPHRGLLSALATTPRGSLAEKAAEIAPLAARLAQLRAGLSAR